MLQHRRKRTTHPREFLFEQLPIFRPGGRDFLRIEVSPGEAHAIDVLRTDIGCAAAQRMGLLAKYPWIARSYCGGKTRQHGRGIGDELRDDVAHEITATKLLQV